MKFKKIFLLFQLLSAVLLVTSFIIYFLKAKIFLDPDFGWALRMGEVILKSGIPKSDPFSYTMPSYPYVDYEWLTHIGIAKIYSLANFTGLTLIFTFIALSKDVPAASNILLIFLSETGLSLNSYVVFLFLAIFRK